MGVLGVGQKGSCAVFEKDRLYEGVHKGGATCAGCACVVGVRGFVRCGHRGRDDSPTTIRVSCTPFFACFLALVGLEAIAEW